MVTNKGMSLWEDFTKDSEAQKEWVKSAWKRSILGKALPNWILNKWMETGGSGRGECRQEEVHKEYSTADTKQCGRIPGMDKNFKWHWLSLRKEFAGFGKWEVTPNLWIESHFNREAGQKPGRWEFKEWKAGRNIRINGRQKKRWQI